MPLIVLPKSCSCRCGVPAFFLQAIFFCLLRMLARAAHVRLLRHSPARLRGFSPARHASGGPSDGRTNAVLLRNIELAARARDLDRVRSLLAASENVPSLAAEVEASQQRSAV